METLNNTSKQQFPIISTLGLIVYIILCIYILNQKKIFNAINVEKYLFYIIFFMVSLFFLFITFIFTNLGLLKSSMITNFIGYLGLLMLLFILTKYGIPILKKYVPENIFLNAYLSYFLLAIGILIALYTIVKQFKLDKPTRNTGTFFGLLYNSLLYFPCLLVNLIDYLKQQYAITPYSAYVILLITSLILVLQFYQTTIQEYILYNGAIVLKKDKINTNYLSNITTFQDLNFEHDNIQYDYALSCMFNIHSFPSNIYSNYQDNISILNLGNQPNVLYNAADNKLVITMKTNNSNSEVVFEKENINLQKWNHLVINYNKGTLDIFYNNQLVSSSPMIIPYREYANVTIGQNKGIEGEMCKCYYFKKSLDKTTINTIFQFTNYLNNL